MKIAIISDIHDNKPRLDEALEIIEKEKIKTCICCGDISSLEIVKQLSEQFDSVYISLGNMDFKLKGQLELIPENVKISPDILEVEIDGKKIAIIHYDYRAKELAKKGTYDYIFYGHTHTPWEKKIGKTKIINPGEIAGQFGRPSFAIFDTKSGKTTLNLLK
ncbi:MAG: metallophosphoesterase family protein [Patescibacteria group bacterium]|nr:metallophosphoesterase family protein [Patescibacteria group bacterium]